MAVTLWRQAIGKATAGLGGFLGGLVADMFVSKDCIRHVQCKTCIIHGVLDRVIEPWHAQMLFARCTAPEKALHLIKGMDHDNCYTPDNFNEMTERTL